VAELRVRPVTPGRWRDLETLFGPRGACAGCWCMYWRLPGAAFHQGKGQGNRRAMRRIVASGEVPGLIAYHGRVPVAWCALAPRERYPRLLNSRVLAPVDDEPVWSVPCFFVARGYRRRGVTRRLLEAAADFAARHGARWVEGYPVALAAGAKYADAFAYTGLARAFERVGFVEVARRSKTRPIMRRATPTTPREVGGAVRERAGDAAAGAPTSRQRITAARAVRVRGPRVRRTR
jgi:GNAT superfamily N-acetyltransferase